LDAIPTKSTKPIAKKQSITGSNASLLVFDITFKFLVYIDDCF
jgi:hypothetical protein